MINTYLAGTMRCAAILMLVLSAMSDATGDTRLRARDLVVIFDGKPGALNAIVNALIAAETMTRINGNTSHAIPHGRLQDALRKYNRLQE